MFRRICPSRLAGLAPQRICVIKPSALGDVVQSLPLLPVLKACYPQARISWVINRELADLVTGHPGLEEVLPFDRRGGWRSWSRLLSELRSRKFDLVFDLQGLLRTGVMTLATRAPVCVGLQTAREGSSLTTNCVIPDSSRSVPAHARLWRMAEILGYGNAEKTTLIQTSQTDQAWAEGIANRLARPILAVHPGARWETKRWPVEKFGELTKLALRQWQGSVVILGSRAELPDATKLQELLGHGSSVELGSAGNAIVNLAGQTSLKQLTALLQKVDMAVSNDSGPMHLAAGLGTPTLGLFTCTSATRSGPAGREHELVSTTVACAASYCKRCPNQGAMNLACLKELDVGRVWLALQRLVSKNGIASGTESHAA